MNTRTARDTRAWTVIVILIVATATAAHHTTTPTGYTLTVALAFVTLVALLAWARVKHLEEVSR